MRDVDSHERNNPPARPGTDEDRIRRDLGALKCATTEGLRPLHHFTPDRVREPQPSTFKETIMSIFNLLTKRRSLTAAVVAVAVALALLVVPISYARTVGWDTELTLAGPALKLEQIKPVAEQMKALLNTDGVAVRLEKGPKGQKVSLSTFVSAEQNADAVATIEAFARSLKAKGFVARTTVMPKVEQVSSNVYAMAQDKIITISKDGKTPEELEEEILAQLEAAGVSYAEVSVTEEDGRTKIKVEAECECGDEGCEEGHGSFPKLVVTSNEPDTEEHHRIMIREEIEETEDGTTLIIALAIDDKKVELRVANPQEMSDEDLADQVTELLSQQGIEAVVTATDGRVRIIPQLN